MDRGQLHLNEEDNKEEIIKEDNSCDGGANKTEKRPFRGINSAFKKLKNNEQLSNQEKDALENFIDEFTTVCTNENIVGETVSKIVLQVN